MSIRNVASPSPGVGAVAPSALRTYVALWCTQWIAMTAGAVTTLVLAIFIYAEYESLVLLGLGFASAYLPFALASPIAGALTDRWGQRRALLVSTVGYVATAAVSALLLAAGALVLWNATVLMVILILFKGLQLTSLESSVPVLVPKRLYDRVNSSRMLLTSTAAIMGPVVTGLLLQWLDMVGVAVVACAVMLPALLAVSVLRIPAASAVGPRDSLWAEIMEAARHIRLARGLVVLLALLGAISIAVGFVELAVQQMVYGFAGGLSIVLIFTVGWAGILATSVVMTITGLPQRLMPSGMLGAGLVFAVALALGGLRPNMVVVALAAFVSLGSTAVIVCAIQTALHLKVPPGLMGRAIGLKNAMTGTAHMIGNVTAGMLGAVLVPLVGRAEVRSPAVAALVGEGGARGFALLMMALGLAVAVTTLVVSRQRRLARWQELPDVTPEDLVAAPASAPAVPARAPR